jgi:two-component system KDP operon response regulator KdpE
MEIEPGIHLLDDMRDCKVIEFITLGYISVNLEKHLFIASGKEVQLTRIELLLLSELARNAGKLMLYEQLLLTRVWSPEYHNEIQILRTWVSGLRHKIQQDPGQPAIIRTVPEMGYMID